MHGLAAAAYKGVDTAVTSGSGNVVTSGAVKTYVDTQVAGVVKYMGTVDSAATLGNLTPDSKGDFCRASAAFTMTAALSSTGTAISVHASDMLVCESVNGKDSATATTYAIIHGEIDNNTWVANTVTAAGYVAAPTTSNKNKVWKTDENGAPAWRDESVKTASDGLTISNATIKHSNSIVPGTATGSSGTLRLGQPFNIPKITYDGQGHISETGTTQVYMPNSSDVYTAGVGLESKVPESSNVPELKVALVDPTLDANAALQRPYSVAGRTYPIIADKNGKLATIVPWVDNNQKVKVGSTTFGNTATVAIAAGSHASVTAANDTITIAATWPTASDSGYAGINKTGTVTSVSAGTGLKITGTASTTPTVGFDDSVVFVFNGGSSTVNV